MKIQYDYQIFTLQKYGGISRYFYEIIRYFKDSSYTIKVLLVFSNNHYISNNEYVKHLELFPHNTFRGKQRLMLFSNKIYTIKVLKRQKFDIFHPTYYDPYFLKYIGDKPFVVTVYDMIHEKFKNNFSPNDKTSEHKRLLCEKATKIIVISKSTKDDLIDLFEIEESKIEIVYLGNSLVVEDVKIQDKKIKNKYLLFVGSRGLYKNFNKFVNAIASILNNDKELSLVCVGGGVFTNEELKLFGVLKINNQVFQYSLDDKTLSSFYQNAELFVFPSLYEGFGIPILEAFACNCPLVCSNTSSLPEIAGNGAEYFNPSDERSIYNAVKNVLYSPEKKEILRQNGKVRLKFFSWKKTYLETKKVYESILK